MPASRAAACRDVAEVLGSIEDRLPRLVTGTSQPSQRQGDTSVRETPARAATSSRVGLAHARHATEALQ